MIREPTPAVELGERTLIVAGVAVVGFAACRIGRALCTRYRSSHPREPSYVPSNRCRILIECPAPTVLSSPSVDRGRSGGQVKFAGDWVPRRG